MRTRLISFLIPLSLFALTNVSSARVVNVGFQNVPLKEGEPIVQIEIQFSFVNVRAITNIPQDWDVHLKLDRGQPFPRIVGSCLHGAGALSSTKDLPTFQVEPFEDATTLVTAEATLYIENSKTVEPRKTLVIEIIQP